MKRPIKMPCSLNCVYRERSQIEVNDLLDSTHFTFAQTVKYSLHSKGVCMPESGQSQLEERIVYCSSMPS